MTSRERVTASANHSQPDRIPVDFGATAVSGMHASVVEDLREAFGLERKPVKINEPFQFLGMVEDDLAEAIGTDVVGVAPRGTFFGFPAEDWKEWRTGWGQTVLVPGGFEVDVTEAGDTLIYPNGDRSARPSGRMPEGGYFFDAIIRQDPLPDDGDLNVEDNLQEFGSMSDDDITYLRNEGKAARDTGKYVIANFGGTGLGDIALVPALHLPDPKGIRDVTEWYISTAARPDYVFEVFARQTDIAISNLERLGPAMGPYVDAVFLCGTDFGTQDGTFCSPDTFRNLYMPHYKRMTEWIHTNTDWKVFKHSCGAVRTFIPLLIEAGFDFLNPVQCSARDMDPQALKDEFGSDLLFWGGGVDTQKTLPFGSPAEVRDEVLERCEIFGPQGGFVFNAIHNVQAKTRVENVMAMIDAVKEYNGRS